MRGQGSQRLTAQGGGGWFQQDLLRRRRLGPAGQAGLGGSLLWGRFLHEVKIEVQGERAALGLAHTSNSQGSKDQVSTMASGMLGRGGAGKVRHLWDNTDS